MRSSGVSNTWCSATVSSTTPSPEPRWPPVTDTASIISARTASATAGSSDSGRPRNAAGFGTRSSNADCSDDIANGRIRSFECRDGPAASPGPPRRQHPGTRVHARTRPSAAVMIVPVTDDRRRDQCRDRVFSITCPQRHKRSAFEPGSSVHNPAHVRDYRAARPSLRRAAAAGRQSRLPLQLPGRLPEAGLAGRAGPRRAAVRRHPRPPLRMARPTDARGSAAGAGMLVKRAPGAVAAAPGPGVHRCGARLGRRYLPGAVRRTGGRPVLTNPKLAVRTVPLCFEAFAVLHSGVTRTPLYAAEHLTRGSVAEARGGRRGTTPSTRRAGCRRTSARLWRITSAAASIGATSRRPATCRR